SRRYLMSGRGRPGSLRALQVPPGAALGPVVRAADGGAVLLPVAEVALLEGLTGVGFDGVEVAAFVALVGGELTAEADGRAVFLVIPQALLLEVLAELLFELIDVDFGVAE